MKKMIIKVESLEEMLQWGDELAKMIDQGNRIPESCIRSFEDPDDLLALFTPTRRAVLAEVQWQPSSITDIALRLQRSTNDVEQDVAALAAADIVTLEQDLVQPVAEEVVFEPIPQAAALP